MQAQSSSSAATLIRNAVNTLGLDYIYAIEVCVSVCGMCDKEHWPMTDTLAVNQSLAPALCFCPCHPHQFSQSMTNEVATWSPRLYHHS
jgi:predicted metallopeptidase